MPQLEKYTKCTGCALCADVCPRECISMICNDDGHYYPRIDSKLCIECKLCEKTCPTLNLWKYASEEKTVPVAAWSKSPHVLLKSSSGGVFAEVAITVLNRGGYVAGVAIEGRMIVPKIICDKNDLWKLQGSKYLQSNSTSIYKQILNLLILGKEVLFSGTPCQVAALLSYVEWKKYTGRLWTIDLICEGVQSRLLLDAYEKRENDKIIDLVSFRDKNDGWAKGYALTINWQKQGKIRRIASNDFLMECSGASKMLRYSCYNCCFRSLNRRSDLTLGDYWGDKKYLSQHSLGLSLVLINSICGKNLLYESNVEIHSAAWDVALVNNPNIIRCWNIMQFHPLRFLLPFFYKRVSSTFFLKLYGNKRSKLVSCFDFFFHIIKYFSQKRTVLKMLHKL